jgi:hypothetical protein
MTRIVLIFGLIAGGILGLFMVIMIPLCVNGHANLERSELLGYTMMILAFILVFFGVRSYRENIAGGSITFAKAFQVGIFITLVACAVYVITWEIMYWGFIPDFGERYAAGMIAKAQASGASAAKLAAMKAEMAQFVVAYKNPLYNVGMTFLEIFPVGLIMTLIAAGFLRRSRTAV